MTYELTVPLPDKKWKDGPRQNIEQELSSMATYALKNLEDAFAKGPVSVAYRGQLTREYHEAMANLRSLAEDTFQIQLERERQERQCAAGQDFLPQWTEALKQEQQDIMERIKGTWKENGSHKENASLTAQPPEPEPNVNLPPGGQPVGVPTGNPSSKSPGPEVHSKETVLLRPVLVKKRERKELENTCAREAGE
ncbi:hypothetical protein H0H81_002379 [Sphagnurus paluster]|uniref:Uncharacterized protein n=1 Tax=Sphagnurus paluster TaxID=117069 RepID=A0A9P7GTB7_9AGAR|nr:hypothetical protein H0H81_002379 [Sphagnurus paluster]